MLSHPGRRQSGGFLFIAMVFVAVVGSSVAIMQTMLEQRREADHRDRQGRYMADYLNAVAGFMAEQGQTAPDPDEIDGLSSTGGDSFEATGTDWLKSETCGGDFPEDEAHLGCNVPSNFNLRYGLSEPVVTFDYTTQPQAAIEFGTVQDNGPDPITAGGLVRVINRHLEAAGYQHINVFHMDEADNSDLGEGELEAEINSQSASDIYVRRDGTGKMTGPLTTEHDNWAMIARDEDGDEVAEAKSAKGSVNVNDSYVRANEAWVSETHELAEEAYTMASKSPQFMSVVESPATIEKPDCPGGLSPQLFVDPIVFLGGQSSGDQRLLYGVRTVVNESSDSWEAVLETNYDDGSSGGSGWERVNDPDYGRIKVTTKCS